MGQSFLDSIKCYVANRPYVEYHGAHEFTIFEHDTITFINSRNEGFGFVAARLNIDRTVHTRGGPLIRDKIIRIESVNDSILKIPAMNLLYLAVDSLKKEDYSRYYSDHALEYYDNKPF